MSHLGERIGEYIFEELSAAESAEAREHVAGCAECRKAVEHFQRTRSLLQAIPDVDPPRSAELVFSSPRLARGWTWRWLVPMGAAAALLIAVAVVGPIHVQWQNGQMTIGFAGNVPASASALEQQNATIQQLQDQVKFLKDAAEQQQRDLYATAAIVQQLTPRSATVGD